MHEIKPFLRANSTSDGGIGRGAFLHRKRAFLHTLSVHILNTEPEVIAITSSDEEGGDGHKAEHETVGTRHSARINSLYGAPEKDVLKVGGCFIGVVSYSE